MEIEPGGGSVEEFTPSAFVKVVRDMTHESLKAKSPQELRQQIKDTHERIDRLYGLIAEIEGILEEKK